jgi:hypothetical protein
MLRIVVSQTMLGLAAGSAIGAASGVFTKDPALMWWWALGSASVALGSAALWAKFARNIFLDAYEDCRGGCDGRVIRRLMWELPDHLHKKKSLPVCSSCFRKALGGRAINPFEDKLAYARKGEEYGNTRKGKKEMSERQDKLRRTLELANPNREKRAAEMLASEADPRSPRSPKRGP